jgi:hypothetical protein
VIRPASTTWVRFLHDARCAAEKNGTTKVTVTVPQALNEPAARRELELYLAAWEARNPGVRARHRPHYDL